MADDNTWSFAFGYNMDIDQVVNSKHVEVLDHAPAILKEWRLVFNPPGIDFVEPAFANVVKGDSTDEVHGVAIYLSKQSVDKMDKLEFTYDKVDIIMKTYDGRALKGYAYVNKPSLIPKGTVAKPSQRYINILLNGARLAGLNESYIEKLQQVETYTPSPEALALRAALPDPDSLPQITVEDLAKHNGTDVNFPDRVAVLGYVVETNKVLKYFKTHKGRDTTTLFLLYYNNTIKLSITNDDFGKPPYPLIKNLAAEEKDYILKWLDHYISRTEGTVVGFLKEFHEQQLSGTTTYKLPQ